MTDYSKLSDRELDAKCAELMGRQCRRYQCDGKTYLQYGEHTWVRMCGYQAKEQPRIPCDHHPAYSADLNAARELEDEIERRDRQYEYVRIMALVNGFGSWDMLTASPRKRAEVFCATMESCAAMEAA